MIPISLCQPIPYNSYFLMLAPFPYDSYFLIHTILVVKKFESSGGHLPPLAPPPPLPSAPGHSYQLFLSTVADNVKELPLTLKYTIYSKFLLWIYDR